MVDNCKSPRKKNTVKPILLCINIRGKENGRTLMLIGNFWYNSLICIKSLYFPSPQLI